MRRRSRSPAPPQRRRRAFAGERSLKDRALDIASEGFSIADLRRPGHPLIYVNDGFQRLTGYTAEEVLGRNCRFLQGADTDPEAREEIRSAIRERRECRVEILNYKKDGAPFWNRLSLTPVRHAAGEVTHYIGVQSDVTDRRRAEDALRAANEELRRSSERMRRSLEAAARIQRSLLPEGLPDVTGARFAWGFRPSDELAGDVLGLVPLSQRRLGLYVVDVAGHGVPAALLSVTLSHWLEPARGQSPLVTPDAVDPTRSLVTPPARVAELLSSRFPFDSRTAQYFTMLYGVLDLDLRAFRFVCAGHPPPVHQPSDSPARFATAAGFPIGIMPGTPYEEHSLSLRPGDRLFLLTDGLLEAQDRSGRELGSDGLLREIEATRSRPLDMAVNEILGAVERFAGPAGNKDDVTLLAVESA